MIVGSFRDSWDMCRIPQTFLGFLGYVRDPSNIFEIFEKSVGSLKDFFWDSWDNYGIPQGFLGLFCQSHDRFGGF